MNIKKYLNNSHEDNAMETFNQILNTLIKYELIQHKIYNKYIY